MLDSKDQPRLIFGKNGEVNTGCSVRVRRGVRIFVSITAPGRRKDVPVQLLLPRKDAIKLIRDVASALMGPN